MTFYKLLGITQFNQGNGFCGLTYHILVNGVTTATIISKCGKYTMPFTDLTFEPVYDDNNILIGFNKI